MSGVIRNWRCLNGRCAHTFESWEPNPECPSCHCVRVEWVPGGGHVAGTAAACDADLRALADVFRMNDMHSARRGEAAKIVKAQPPPASGPVHTFAPGFSAPVNPQHGAVCVPTTSHVDFKAKVGIGNKLAPSKVFPGVGSNTAVEATHRPRP